MRKFVMAVVLTGALAGTASADGGNEVCNSLASDDATVACLKAIEGKSVDSTGAAACGRLASDDSTVECMRAIAGHAIQPGAAKVCDRLASSSDTVRCMAAIADRQYNDDELATCDERASGDATVECMAVSGRLPPPPAPVLMPKAPDAVCDGLSDDPDDELVAECHDLIEGVYVSRLAAAACDRIKSPRQTLRCMRAIVSRRYSKREVLLCDQETDDQSTIDCFNESGLSDRRKARRRSR